MSDKILPNPSALRSGDPVPLITEGSFQSCSWCAAKDAQIAALEAENTELRKRLDVSRLRTYAPMRRSRPSLSRTLQSELFWRSDGRCEVVLVGLRCLRRAQDDHHVQKRSQGGSDDADNVLAICREHHDRTDWPYKRGRLVIRPLGQGRFECAIVTVADKFAVRTP